MLVMPWIMPMGTNQTRAMIIDTKNAHQCIRVGQPRQTPSEMPSITRNSDAYHHCGTSLYFLIMR